METTEERIKYVQTWQEIHEDGVKSEMKRYNL